MHLPRLLTLLIFFFTVPVLARQEIPLAPQTTQPSGRRARGAFDGASGAPTTQPAEEKPVVTEHTLTLEGQPLKYKATTGTITLKDDQQKPRAKMFFIAYDKDAPADSDRADRPITFVFNGGPGAAAIWLHLGTAGPKRVVLPDDGAPPSPPYKLADNTQTWLDFTDLVFIDPVGTGYSRPEGDPQRAREFYSVRGDIDAVSDFIRIYLTSYQRWLSPKFLAGESYGTFRAAGLSEQLHDRYGIDLSGITLLSTVMNLQLLDFSAANDATYALYLPSYAVIAQYHKKLAPALLSKDRRALADEVQRWALGEYMQALLAGSSLDEAQFNRVAQQYARYTGLSVEYVKRARLRVSAARFEKELLADQNRLIGRMDGRFTGHNADPINDTPEYDPTLTGYVGLFSGTFNDYVRRELKYENEQTYEFLSPRVGPWDFSPGGPGSGGYVDVSTTLRRAIVKMPKLKVMVASGYYDLATPFAVAEYSVNQMPLGKDLRANITQKYYEGGHMMYLNRSALAQLKTDLREFYTQAAAPTTQP
jgi:carboxypeptidase C (cathepsin A)